jgi:predicted esterase
MNRLQTVDGANQWIVAAVQGLHRFYRSRTNEVVASWMTSQDRTLAIADNCAYVAGVIDAVSREWAADRTLVLSGFSQGVAMAFRAATSIVRPVRGVIACGGDVPPELDPSALARIPAVLIGRGLRDEWYTAEKLESDVQRLRAAGVAVQTATFDAGHEWPPEFSRAVSLFLKSRDT